MKNLYVLHEYGAPSHYNALCALANKNNMKVVFVEFNIMYQILALKKSLSGVFRLVHNLFFMLLLYFSPRRKIVFGIAPYNKHLSFLMKAYKKHEWFFHTSYTCWNGTRFHHKPQNGGHVELWKNFIGKCAHVFAVSEKAKVELLLNGYSTDSSISIVNHSYVNQIAERISKKDLSFISVGTLCAHKGTDQLLEIFSRHPEAKLTLVGKGEMEPLVRKYSTQYPNIRYLGFLKGMKYLEPEYKKHSFLLLNSHRTESWEELFGMAIIEGMACGCVPITTNHPGPREILTNQVDGLICEEGSIECGVLQAISMSEGSFATFQKNAVACGQKYYCENIAEKWKRIFAEVTV